MFVDPRVAHARAKLQLSDRAVTREPLEKRMRAVLFQGIVHIGSRKLSAREAGRYVTRSLVPALQRRGFMAEVREFDSGPRLSACMAVCDPTNGLRYVQYLCRLAGSDIVEGPVLTISPHALARCLQRNGALKLSEIREELEVAVATAIDFAYLAQQCGWKQVFIPTPRGVFLGEWHLGTGVAIRTYIRPGANDRETKWTDVLAALPTLPAYADLFDGGEVAFYRHSLQELATKQAQEMARRFPFLSRAYERRADPLDAAWNIAREADLAVEA